MVAPILLNISPERNLSRYLHEIYKFPMLSADQEVALARRGRESGDPEAVKKLVTSHLRLVPKIARGFRGYGWPLSELISEGNVGILLAVKRFDPDRGVRFATYATWWIRAAIQEYILRSWSLVRTGTTSSQKKLFFNLGRLKREMLVVDDGRLQPERVAEIARRLDVPEREVIDMNDRLAAPDCSLNAAIQFDSESEWQDYLTDQSESQETTLAEHEELTGRLALLPGALRTLNERQLHILTERRLKEQATTLDELSQHYRISRERVRQIELAALKKLQQAMRALLGRYPGAEALHSTRESRQPIRQYIMTTSN
jgi:RNA polymerase sigma-32 factor